MVSPCNYLRQQQKERVKSIIDSHKINLKSSALDFAVKSCVDLTIDLKSRSVAQSIIDLMRFFCCELSGSRRGRGRGGGGGGILFEIISHGGMTAGIHKARPVLPR